MYTPKVKFIFKHRLITISTFVTNAYDLYDCALTYITMLLCELFSIESIYIPNKTTYLGCGFYDYGVFPILESLPPSLIFLKSPCYRATFDSTIVSALPKQLEYYQPSEYFNQEFKVPDRLKYLNFSSTSHFNQKITLPSTIYYVHFGRDFNQTIMFTNVNNLQYLLFGLMYNQPIKPPPTVTVLCFGHCFNQQIILPPKLKYLSLGHDFKHNVVLPSYLKTLHLNTEHNQILDNLPNTLETLYIHNNHENQLNNLPNGLKKLTLYNVDYKLLKFVRGPRHFTWEYCLNKLPKSLVYFQLENNRIIPAHNIVL